MTFRGERRGMDLAPPKDDYIPDSESEGENERSLRQAPVKVFRNGKLKVHKK